MPKIVDREQKREEIAKLSISLLAKSSFSKLTVSQVAKNANIAKGSIYRYFSSKEDILFAIIKQIMSEYDKEVIKNIESSSYIEDKVLSLFQLCISKNSIDEKRRKIYKDFTSICLSKSNQKMVNFQEEIRVKYIQWLKNILADGIKNQMLKSEAIEFADGLFAMAEGILLLSHYDATILTKHVKSLFKIIRKNKEKR